MRTLSAFENPIEQSNLNLSASFKPLHTPPQVPSLLPAAVLLSLSCPFPITLQLFRLCSSSYFCQLTLCTLHSVLLFPSLDPPFCIFICSIVQFGFLPSPSYKHMNSHLSNPLSSVWELSSEYVSLLACPTCHAHETHQILFYVCWLYFHPSPSGRTQGAHRQNWHRV